MFEQVLQPLLLFLLIIIALYTIVLVVLLKKTARLIVNDSTNIESGQQSSQPIAHQSQSEKTLRKFKNKDEEAILLNQTFRKFVPKQFVDHFAKHGSDTLELGRAVEEELAILFSDIRGFSSLSEQMKPQELMNFLNSYEWIVMN